MPAQRTSMSACHASGHQSDSPTLPPYIRQLSAVSTRIKPTPEGHSTTAPADSGPASVTTFAAAPTLTRPATPRPVMCPNPAAHLHPVPVKPELPAIAITIRRLRRRRGLSQTACAELIGYSESWLSQVERGERGIDSIRAMRELARVLDVDVHQLIEVVL